MIDDSGEKFTKKDGPFIQVYVKTELGTRIVRTSLEEYKPYPDIEIGGEETFPTSFSFPLKDKKPILNNNLIAGALAGSDNCCAGENCASYNGDWVRGWNICNNGCTEGCANPGECGKCGGNQTPAPPSGGRNPSPQPYSTQPGGVCTRNDNVLECTSGFCCDCGGGNGFCSGTNNGSDCAQRCGGIGNLGTLGGGGVPQEPPSGCELNVCDGPQGGSYWWGSLGAVTPGKRQCWRCVNPSARNCAVKASDEECQGNIGGNPQQPPSNPGGGNGNNCTGTYNASIRECYDQITGSKIRIGNSCFECSGSNSSRERDGCTRVIDPGSCGIGNSGGDVGSCTCPNFNEAKSACSAVFGVEGSLINGSQVVCRYGLITGGYMNIALNCPSGATQFDSEPLASILAACPNNPPNTEVPRQEILCQLSINGGARSETRYTDAFETCEAYCDSINGEFQNNICAITDETGGGNANPSPLPPDGIQYCADMNIAMEGCGGVYIQPLEGVDPNLPEDSFICRHQDGYLLLCGGVGELPRKFTKLAEAQSNTTVDPGVYKVKVNNRTQMNIRTYNRHNISFFFDQNNDGVQQSSEPVVSNNLLDIEVTKEKDIINYQFEKGWNLIGLEMTGEELRKASQLLEMINKAGVAAVQIVTYDGQMKTYTRRENVTVEEEAYGDFDIVPGQGYFVRSMSRGTVALEGNRFAEAVPIRLINDWNLISIQGPNLNYTAEGFIDKAGEQGLKYDTVATYESDNYSVVVKDNNTFFGNDFNLISKRGYFVRVTEGGGQEFTP